MSLVSLISIIAGGKWIFSPYSKKAHFSNSVIRHSNWIYSVTFSADCKYLVTGSRNNTCKLWDVKNGFKLINTIKGHNNPISSVTFSPQDKYLAISWNDNIWSIENQFDLTNTIEGHNIIFHQLLFMEIASILQRALTIKLRKQGIQKMDLNNTKIIEGHTETSFSSSFSVNSKYLATGSRDKTCKIWDIEKGFELIATIQGHIEDILSIAFSFLRQQISSNCFW
ncbi:hypothetical protein ABPG74_019065 [Tetrahymena malaccensis]